NFIPVYPNLILIDIIKYFQEKYQYLFNPKLLLDINIELLNIKIKKWNKCVILLIECIKDGIDNNINWPPSSHTKQLIFIKNNILPSFSWSTASFKIKLLDSLKLLELNLLN